MKLKMRTLAATLWIAFAPMAAHASSDSVAAKIATNFTTLAGSQENAVALVNALRNGTDVNLTTVVPPPEGSTEPPTTTTTTFTPPTGKMGWGNVKHSLALAQDALAKAGITNPTAEQLQTALVGGDIVTTNADGTTTTTTLKGILTMRAEGMGWGNIAKAGGTKLGPVTSKVKMGNTASVVASAPGDSGVTAKSKGITTATGAVASGSASGLVTADGATAGHTPKGNAYGRGIVSAAGGGATTVAATGGGKPSGAGVVNAGGGNAAAISSAGGNNAGGNGNGKGNGKGGGKPGG